ncbi:hypothetical protein GCM10009525_51110 [Streptosporangium amethystogenes subsp. fukuiense]
MRDEHSTHVLRTEQPEAECRTLVDVHLGAWADGQHLNHRKYTWTGSGKFAIDDAPACEPGDLVEVEAATPGEVGFGRTDEFRAAFVAIDKVVSFSVVYGREADELPTSEVSSCRRAASRGTCGASHQVNA